MKNNICRIVALTLVSTLISISCSAAADLELIQKNMEKWYYTQFDQGSGTQKDPYIIDEVEDLEFIADIVFRDECTYEGKYFRMNNDIYFNDITKPEEEWKGYFPIGWDERAFEGNFDGGGYTIYGFKPLKVNYNNCESLFGRVRNGSIKNLTMSDSYMYRVNFDSHDIAVFVNRFSCDGGSASIENCHVVNQRGSVTQLATEVIATNEGTITIKDCTAIGEDSMIEKVYSSNDAVVSISGLVRSPQIIVDENEKEKFFYSEDGIIGDLYASSSAQKEGTVIIENCVNNCDIYNDPMVGYSSVDRDEYRYIATGGILDASFKKSGTDIIRNCTNNGLVRGLGGVGGIAGVFTNGKIENCINNGQIYGVEARVGGIVGQHTAGDIICCVNRGSVNVQDCEILVGVRRFGGIAGVNNGVIESCINYGDINGSPMESGSTEMSGIAGRGSYIYNSANLGNLIRITAVSGGVAGTVALNVPEAVVDNCYNAGQVSASPYNSGSVIGLSTSPTKNCYYLAGTHPYGRYTDKADANFDLPDYKVLSYQEMTNPESLTGFDFVNKWIMPSENGFPVPRGAHFGDVALPRETEIDINGKITKLSGYNINGNNYYKIRDIAFLLNGTKSNFSVDWNAEEGVIVIKTNTPYTPVGSENNLNDKNDRAVERKTEKALLNEENIELRAYKIDGSNYFTIREVADIIGFEVDWDEKERRILIVA